jgi:hypothetical protein
MARAWIELDGEQAGWGPTRVVVSKLGSEGYFVQVLTGSGPKVLIITGRTLSGAGGTGRPMLFPRVNAAATC